MYPENKQIFDFLNITNYHEKGFTGKGIIISVFDRNFIPEDVVDYVRFGDQVKPMPLVSNSLRRWSEDGNDHGVVVLDVIRQVAPDATVYFMGDGQFSTFMGRAERVKSDIVTISQGLQAYAEQASKESKAILLASAGNDGIHGQVLTPAREKEWVAVGAGRLQNNGTVERASYSTVGEGLEILALSGITVKGATGEKRVFRGTSCSSPVAAAMLALYMQAKKMDREEARAFLHENAYDMYEEGRDHKTGYGLFKLPEDIPELEEVIDVSESEKQFTDIDHHWAKESIQKQVSKGRLEGFPDGTFRPDEPVTRAQLAVILDRLDQE